jgi:transposase InsO family protein
MNSACERFLGSVRREVLDHVVIVGEDHLKRVLDEYSFQYFNTMRPHQGLGQRVVVSATQKTCDQPSKVIAVPVLGGLHHDYRAAA